MNHLPVLIVGACPTGLMLNILLSIVTSFLIGLLIGIEREHSHAEGVQPIGVRTFILFSLLGTLAAILNSLLLTVVISCFAFSVILLGYVRSTSSQIKRIDIGVTTEVAAGIVYCLGYLVPTDNFMAIIICAMVLLVLVERKRLHVLARKKFATHEIETTIILIIFALGILPILPNHTIDPWDLFNPRNFGILIATIAAIQFSGYILMRLFGERFGIAIIGFLGGLVSSTAVFATLPNTLCAHPKFRLVIIASAILATLAMLLEIMLIVFVASATLFFYIYKPILAMAIVGFIIALLLMCNQKSKERFVSATVAPLNVLSILYTSIFITLTFVLVAITKRYVGTDGVLLVSFLGGLFEIHGISLATALLYLDQHLRINNAALVLYVAIISSFISKLFLLWGLAPPHFAFRTSLCMLVMLSGGIVTYWLFV